MPCGDFRSSVMLRLLRCRFWKSAFSRGPPGPSPFSRCGGVSILMTLAPQSASWRTQVGPDLTRVRSRTVNRERAVEALGNGITGAPKCLYCPGRQVWRPTFPDLPGLVYRPYPRPSGHSPSKKAARASSLAEFVHYTVRQRRGTP